MVVSGGVYLLRGGYLLRDPFIDLSDFRVLIPFTEGGELHSEPLPPLTLRPN